MITFTRQVIQHGDEVRVVAEYGKEAERTTATEAEIIYAQALRRVLTAAIAAMNPADISTGKTLDQAMTRLDISRDIREAGQ